MAALDVRAAHTARFAVELAQGDATGLLSGLGVSGGELGRDARHQFVATGRVLANLLGQSAVLALESRTQAGFLGLGRGDGPFQLVAHALDLVKLSLHLDTLLGERLAALGDAGHFPRMGFDLAVIGPRGVDELLGAVLLLDERAVLVLDEEHFGIGALLQLEHLVEFSLDLTAFLAQPHDLDALGQFDALLLGLHDAEVDLLNLEQGLDVLEFGLHGRIPPTGCGLPPLYSLKRCQRQLLLSS